MIKQILIKVISYLVPIKKKRITILDETRFSGSNSTALYEYILNKHLNEKYEINLFKKESLTIKGKLIKNLYLMRSQIIITTHSPIKCKKKQVLIQLWHGIPLKSMGLLDKTYSEQWCKSDKKSFDKIDFITSTSVFYNTLINATIGQKSSQYVISGYPRNDYLINKKKELNFKNLFRDFNEEYKTIFFIPTFKIGYADRVEGNNKEKNFFGLDNFNMIKFSEFLEENKLNLVLKLHPFEEEYYKKNLLELNLKNIYFLDSNLLEKHQTDLYCWLAKSDMLITDYSSVYFDYLLTTKPMLFINSDEEEYRSTRGFLLEPYSYWTPGPKVSNQKSLEEEILKLINDKKYFMKERENMRCIFHWFNDGLNCERVWSFIENKYLSKKSEEF